MTKHLLDPLYHTLIGFENLLNRASVPNSSYPPYNIIKNPEEDCYVLEIAVSGFKKHELEVALDGTTLTVKGTKESPDNQHYLVRGLAHRSWTRTWTLESDISVSDVTLQDGVLIIVLTPQKTKSHKVLTIN